MSKILPLIEAQLEFEHYYVQKGVGWTLRETYNVYPKATFQFMKKHIRRISAHAFSAATEKMSSDEREELKQLRRRKSV